jgi:hypothetical protein
MPEFIVVDLGSKARAVGQHVEGWPRSRVLAWLRQFGEVYYEPYFSRPGVDHYSFVSPCGRSSGFWFEANTLVLQARDRAGIRFVEVPCPADGGE